MRNISIFSFFSGSGLLDLGFENAGFRIEFVNEYYKPFLEAYKYSRGNLKYKKPKYGYSSIDIFEYLVNEYNKKEIIKCLKEESKNNVIGFIGGPPCPDFSIGGKNKGRNGENGKLSEIYIDLVCSLKPDFILFENVKGLWRTKIHRIFFEEMKNKLLSAGYLLTEQLINSIEFGVPQDRDRIILFGVKRKILKTSDNINNFNWSKYKKYNKENVLGLNWPITNDIGEMDTIPGNIIYELTVDYWFKKNNVSEHINNINQFRPRAALSKFISIKEGDVSKKSFKRLHRYRFSPTAAYGNNEVHIHPIEPRRISVAEAMAIQSLPKEFSFPVDLGLTNMFKTIGNGVPYLLGKGVARTIKDFLSNNIKEIHNENYRR